MDLKIQIQQLNNYNFSFQQNLLLNLQLVLIVVHV
jgi:hypothetical protein